MLTESQHAQIHTIILSNRPAAEITDDVGCSECALYKIKMKLSYFDSSKPLQMVSGSRRSITTPVLDVMYEHLLEKPELYQYEMIDWM